MCEWINNKSFRDIYEFGTCWILQLPAPHHIHFKPLAGRDQIFSFGILLGPGAMASDQELFSSFVWSEKRPRHSATKIADCLHLLQVHVWTIAGQLPPPTENKILKSQLFTFCLCLTSLSSSSRESSPSPPLCLPSSLKSCEEKQAKSGKMCSYLTHATLVSSITQSH